MTDYTIADTSYWRETDNRLIVKTSYEFNDKDAINSFPQNLGDWTGSDFKYPDRVYETLNSEIIMSRTYNKGYGNLVWMDIINSKVGESFHTQRICVEGAGWTVENETIVDFRIADPPNPYIKLYANRLDISKKDKKQVMVYWFLFKKFGSNDSVAMIRLSTPVVRNESQSFNTLKDFIENQLFQAMYERVESENEIFGSYIIEKYKTAGMLAILILLAIPIYLIAAGIRPKNQEKS